jgi:hypothetical protein
MTAPPEFVLALHSDGEMFDSLKRPPVPGKSSVTDERPNTSGRPFSKGQESHRDSVYSRAKVHFCEWTEIIKFWRVFWSRYLRETKFR